MNRAREKASKKSLTLLYRAHLIQIFQKILFRIKLLNVKPVIGHKLEIEQ